MQSRIVLASVLAVVLIAGAAAQTPAPQTAPAAPQEILLWPQGAPGALGDRPEDKPSLTPFARIANPGTSAAVIVCPGGGYTRLASDHEGTAVAQWLNAQGIRSFVLKYRLGPNGYHHPAMLQDAQRAVRWVRAHAADYQIDPQRIGIMGFSAGGHMASTAGTHFTAGKPDDPDPVERVSSRPDVMLLIYPVITMGEFAHGGSRRNLLGDNPSADLVDLMSNEKQVARDTPPAFLVHAENDATVPVENSIQFAAAMRRAGAAVEFHLFEKGPPHGYGLAVGSPVVGVWPRLAETWLKQHGF